MKTISSVSCARGLLVVAALGLLCGGFAVAAPAVAQQSFKTPDAAADALANAARAKDRAALLAVLGKDGAEIASSGDPVADADIRQKFVDAYDAKHEIKTDGDAKATLIIGKEDF